MEVAKKTEPKTIGSEDVNTTPVPVPLRYHGSAVWVTNWSSAFYLNHVMWGGSVATSKNLMQVLPFIWIFQTNELKHCERKQQEKTSHYTLYKHW